MQELVISAIWDDEAEVWVAQSDDVPGLATEANTLEALTEKLRVMIPELLECNSGLPVEQDVPWELVAKRSELLRIRR